MRSLLLAVALSQLVACGPKKAPGAVAAADSTVVEPVRFGTNDDDVRTADNLMRVGAVAERLKADDKLVVVLVGHTDTSGAAERNLALSEARAGAVRELVLQASGVDGARVLVLGHGEDHTTGDATLDRRVEFVFGRQKGKEAPDAVAIVAAGEPGVAGEAAPTSASASASGEAAAASSPTQAGVPAGETDAKGRDNVVPTGLADVDALFVQVQGLLDLVRGAQDDIAAADANLRTALGVGADASLEDALGTLKTQAKGALTVKMDGGKPVVAVKPGAAPEVSKAVGALNGLVASLGSATKKLAQVPKQAGELVNQAKTIPSRLPTMLKDAGLGMKALPGTLKAVKHNLKLTAQVPKEAVGVGKTAAETFKTIGSTLK